jgi:hypothetical protein
LDAGLSKKTIQEWSVDPIILLADHGSQGSVFDALEDMDAGDVLAKLVELNKLNQEKADPGLKNSSSYYFL